MNRKGAVHIGFLVAALMLVVLIAAYITQIGSEYKEYIGVAQPISSPTPIPPPQILPATHSSSTSSSTPKIDGLSMVLAINGSGGMCMYGGCISQTTVYANGTYFVSQGAGSTLEVKRGELNATRVNALVASIRNTDFDAIRSREFSGTCPIAYDGQQFEYIFDNSGKTEILNSCKQEIDYDSPLFRAIANLEL